MDTQNTFYVFDTENKIIVEKHNSFKEAELSAIRLAEANPDIEFVVFELKASFTAETSVHMKCKYYA